jgi:hypothetical protein
MEQIIKNLRLLLMYLTCWEEQTKGYPPKTSYKCWCGYLYEVLKDLHEKKLIGQFMHRKKFVITKEGIKKAEELKKKFLEERELKSDAEAS